jgi:hypothetical protein
MTTGDWIAVTGVFVAALGLIVAFVAMLWQAKQTHASNSVLGAVLASATSLLLQRNDQLHES